MLIAILVFGFMSMFIIAVLNYFDYEAMITDNELWNYQNPLHI